MDLISVLVTCFSGSFMGYHLKMHRKYFYFGKVYTSVNFQGRVLLELYLS